MARRFAVLLCTVFLLVGALACEDNSTSENNTTPGTDAGADGGVDACSGDACGEDPCDPNPCSGGEECVVADGQPSCECPAGTHASEDGCAPDESCSPTTCNEHGTCDDSSGVPTCDCEQGYLGDACSQCDTANGWESDGEGGCTDDPCSLLDCNGDRVCVVDGGQATCECPAGYHDEDGQCVLDETCSPTTCNAHGDCDEAQGQITCSCDDGWAGQFCGECDEANGYHSDGQGGCTTDPCLPNPCGDANRSVCVTSGTDYTCECDSGFHLEGSSCVADETCQADSCSGAGTCDDAGGVVTCTCDTGYVGDACDSCDSAAGYHDDGQGNCTTDPCLPNPCSDPNKTACVSSGTDYACECDTGFHPDGQGGCTDDPCLPDTCAAQNKACRVVSGTAECYTPDCDDQDPCTTDTLVNGACEYTTLSDGSSCSTDVCLVNQTCQSGQCVGTMSRDCDDGNPCTDDSCDATQGGCVSVDDDTNVPDDGVACTDDTCSSGVASHTPNDTICDDTQWCTGQEACAPSDPSADADGCITENVPQAPADPGPCQEYTTCDESTQSFTLVNLAAGTNCNDGIMCTTGDACDTQGQCTGQLQTPCSTPGTACGTTTPIGSIDVPVAEPTITVTFDGQDPSVSEPYYSFAVYAVDRQTNAYTRLVNYYKSSSSGGQLTVTTKLLPGVYDLVFATDVDALSFSTTPSSYEIPYGRTVIRRDVAIPAGPSTLDIDIAPQPVTVDLTFEGQDPLVSEPYYSFAVYAVDRETNAWHRIANYYKSSSSGGQLTKTTKIMPGTYDIVYATDVDALSFSTTPSSYEIPYGRTVLQRGVTIDSANSTFTVDIEPTPVTINLTFDGQDPLVTEPYYSFAVYAVDRETGAWHRIANYYKSSTSGGQLSKTTKMMPGTYDIVYATDVDALSFSTTPSSYEIPYGRTVLQRGVTVDSANSTLNVGIEPQPVTVNLTFDGQDPLVSEPYYSFAVYAVDRETDAWHRIANYYKSSSSGGQLTETTKVMPGTYDIVYATDVDALSFSTTPSSYEIPYGRTVLQRGVTIDGTNSTFNVDVTPQPVTVNLTFAGQDPLVAEPYYSFAIYAVDRETQAFHRIANYYKSSSSGGQLTETTKVMPGTYDIVYATDVDALSFSTTPSSYEIAYGRSVLQQGVTIDGANTTFSVDVAPVAYDPTVLFQGADPQVSEPYYSFSVYAVDQQTDAFHRITNYYKSSSSGGQLTETTKMMPGTYDILYATDVDALSFSTTPNSYEIPYGRSYLDMCVEIQ